MSRIDVFVSYKREERETAKALADALTSRGYVVWWDVDLLPGDRFALEIEAVIDTCRCVVVLWSPASVASDFVRDEARRGQARGVLIPVFIEPTRPPLGFGEIHAHDLTEWTGAPDAAELAPLFVSVERLLEREGAERAPQPIEARAEEAALTREAAFWKGVETSDDPQSAQAYLDAYSEDGLFAPLARRKLAALRTPVSAGIIGAPPRPAPLEDLGPAPVAPAAAPARPPRFSETWRIVHAFRVCPGQAQTLAWSPDSRLIAAEGVDSSNVSVWDAIDGRGVCAFPGPREDARPNCVAFSGSGALVVAGYHPDAHVFDAESGEGRLVLRGHRAVVIAAAFGADDAHILTASKDDTIALWGASDGRELARLDSTGWGDVERLEHVRLAGAHRVRAFYDTLETRVWGSDAADPPSFTPARLEEGPREWTLDGAARRLTAADHNTALELRDADSDALLASIGADRFKLATVRVADDEKSFLMIVEDAAARIWSTQDGGELAELNAPSAWIRAAEYSPDATMIATGDSDGLARIWRRSTT